MKKIRLIIISIIIIVAVIIVTISIEKYFNKNNAEQVVNITGADFTLNDIKNSFLKTDYAKNNSCTGKVSENSLEFDCKEKYNFAFDGSVLTLEISNSQNKDIFKYLVDIIQTFYGSNIGDYYESMDKFLNKEFQTANLTYQIIDDKINLSVDLTEKLEVYKEKETITEKDLIDINKTDYRFIYNDYKIDNIELIYNQDINWLTFGGVLFGNDKNVLIELKFYNQNKELIYETHDDLSLLVDVGFPYYGFVINIDLDDANIAYSDINSYNIILKKAV